MKPTRLLLTAVLGLCLLSGCAAAPVQKGAGPGPGLFTFHDGFWLNLHQLLLAEGRPRRRPVPGPERTDPRWAEAVERYRKDYSQRFFLDEQLAKLNQQLAEEDEAALGPAIGPELKAALEPVAPLFRQAEWPEDHRRSQEWTAAVQGRLERSGPALAREVARVFGVAWPSAPVRVETSKQAGPFGAFSLGTPFMITISTADPGYAGDAALEMLFHEAAHGMDAAVVAALERECARRAVPVPEALDHALLFFAVGELARKQLGPGYVPYAYANGLYTRSPSWTRYEVAMRAEWVPYLEGRSGLEPAIAGVVGRLLAPRDAGARE